ncbi:MAG TPA: PIN domain-containing protein [Thermoanaerobaculia bacterium]|nr:PIN domain-containing protein [Thermoanaerobaculia bacterium]
MTGPLPGMIRRYGRKGIILDTNILLLHLVGRFDPSLISRFKRTAQFGKDDYLLLDRLLDRFETIVTTPGILAEVNSLSGQLPEPVRSQYFLLFSREIAAFQEDFVESRQLAALAEFVKFGLTDAGIGRVARERYLILTDDFRLSQYLGKLGHDVVNFNHIRVLGWS